VPLQNIQARVRAPGVWMLAKLNNALLLATSNRSEAAVGYARMDGDTCGGLSPIAGIDKAFLREWLARMESQGPGETGAYPPLSVVTSQTAERLAVWVERFFTLWSRNQWKRERYAPSFHVDDENLDPKTCAAFPSCREVLPGSWRI
jgi:NAD+ synthase (glutamine-hydrolysing)